MGLNIVDHYCQYHNQIRTQKNSMSYPLDVPTQKFIGKDFTVAKYYRNKYCFRLEPAPGNNMCNRSVFFNS